jgi:hypothetical protein
MSVKTFIAMGRAPSTLWTLALALASVLSMSVTDHATCAELARINYYYPENWLCRPDHNEACEADLTAMVIGANGKSSYQRFHADPAAPIDCFYVYPTVSREATPISDMNEGQAEREVVRQQFAPFGVKCRLYAPLYRQITLASLAAEARGAPPNFDPTTPARDVIDAWKTYIAHDNANRGFVLIGHSQGSAILKYIVEGLIDGTPLAKQLVSVIIPGTDIDVPEGKDVGGTFVGIPLCHDASQTACVIVYSSYLASDPPGADAYFGMSARPGMRDGCVDPALLASGETALDAFLPPALGGLKTRARIPFFTYPGLLSGACVADAKHTYLAITIGQDPRAPQVQQYLHTVADRNRGWGLHEVDINLALGNLLAIVGMETKAWLAHNGHLADAPP